MNDDGTVVSAEGKATAGSPRETAAFLSRAFFGGCGRDVRGAIFRRGSGSGTASSSVSDALSDDPDFEHVFADGAIVRAPRKASVARGISKQGTGCSGGGLTGKTVAVADAPGHLVRFVPLPGRARGLTGNAGPARGPRVRVSD